MRVNTLSMRFYNSDQVTYFMEIYGNDYAWSFVDWTTNTVLFYNIVPGYYPELDKAIERAMSL